MGKEKKNLKFYGITLPLPGNPSCPSSKTTSSARKFRNESSMEDSN
jgi:hypothetical protein